MKIGVISDTHGVIHPAVFERFRGVERILHAGDLGDESVLERLEAVAPVTAVRGNVDHWPGAARLPESVDLALGGLAIHMTHIGRPEEDWARALDARSGAERPRLVICGHTHAPRRAECGGYLFLNPGSAGRRRFSLPLSVALLDVAAADPARGTATRFDCRLVEIEKGGES